MPRIAFLAVHQHRPNGVQLSMLSKQMISTESLWRNIPDAHLLFGILFLTPQDGAGEGCAGPTRRLGPLTSPPPIAGGVDQSLARSGVPTPGGVRGRAMIDDRTRSLEPSAVEPEGLSSASLGRHAPTIFNGLFFNESNIDINTSRPSSLPNLSSAQRSGCGIIPNTFPSALRIPAILSMEPFGFASAATLPSGVQ